MTTEPIITSRILTDDDAESDNLDSLLAELREPVLINMAEQSGDPVYMLALTDMYLIETDRPELAKPWLDKMLEQDYLPAYATQAQMYMFGKYFEQDLDKAIELFDQLAERYIAADDYPQYGTPLAFCYLSLAQIYQARQNAAMMMMHYFNALQLSDAATADRLANMFNPQTDPDPAGNAALTVLHCVFLTLAVDFIHQQCDSVEDHPQRHIMLRNSAVGLTEQQSQQVEALVNAWHDGEHQQLIEAALEYVNG
ncbi:hypothetical protein [Budvicia diplopodorum]|uniref:hypothetical protein n=1 Tax=Budvicia diplopodorum TaxID=1119056 RepID=UPI001356815E|nr:hypothetical protein [Budvicia diplopodorum]